MLLRLDRECVHYQHFDSNTSYSRKLSGKKGHLLSDNWLKTLRVTFIITNLSNLIDYKLLSMVIGLFSNL